MWHHVGHAMIYGLIAALAIVHFPGDELIKAVLYGGLAFLAGVQAARNHKLNLV